jgi:hypothetical protein
MAKIKEILKEEIKLWEEIRAGKAEDAGSEGPLCRIYFDEITDGGLPCTGCPIQKFTGNKNGCEGSPYEKWTDHHESTHWTGSYPYSVTCPKCIKLANKMVKFLKKLRSKA